MNLTRKLTRWVSLGVIFFSSLWMINSSYLGYIFTRDHKENLLNGETHVSLITGALSGYWPVLLILGVLFFSTGCYICWKFKNHLILFLLLSSSSLLVANILNVLVVSAGFELS